MSEQPASDDTTGTGKHGSELTYEAAREELVEVVRALESGGTNLEESLALWERGEHLAQVCQRWLDGARKRLDEAVRREDPDA